MLFSDLLKQCSDLSGQREAELDQTVTSFIPRSDNGDPDYEKFGSLAGDWIASLINKQDGVEDGRANFTSGEIFNYGVSVANNILQMKSKDSPMVGLLRGALLNSKISPKLLEFISSFKGVK